MKTKHRIVLLRSTVIVKILRVPLSSVNFLHYESYKEKSGCCFFDHLPFKNSRILVMSAPNRACCFAFDKSSTLSVFVRRLFKKQNKNAKAYLIVLSNSAPLYWRIHTFSSLLLGVLGALVNSSIL